MANVTAYRPDDYDIYCSSDPPVERLSRKTLPKNGAVYFMLAVGTPLVKVGWTSGDPTKRLASLQVGCPHQLIILAAIPAGAYFEGVVHRKLWESHVRGEWFRLSPAVLGAFHLRDNTRHGTGQLAWLSKPVKSLIDDSVVCQCDLDTDCPSLRRLVQDDYCAQLLEEMADTYG
jgi:hypothetical protein